MSRVGQNVDMNGCSRTITEAAVRMGTWAGPCTANSEVWTLDTELRN